MPVGFPDTKVVAVGGTRSSLREVVRFVVLTPILSLATISSSTALINESRFQSASVTFRLIVSCSSAGSLVKSTGHNKLP